jgi:hypothetical protein
VGKRIGRGLPLLDERQRLVNVDSLSQGNDPGGNRRRALPTGTAVQIGSLSLLERRDHGRDRLLERLRRQAAEIDQLDPLLLDPRLGQRRYDSLPLARGIFAVLGQVQHALDPDPLKHRDIVAIERVRADHQTIEDVGKSI